MRMRSLLPAPGSCESRGQAGSVSGGRRPSAEQTRSAIDGSGMGRTLPGAGAGSPVLDLGFMPLPFETPRPVADRQAMPRTGAPTGESGETAVDTPSLPRGRGLFSVRHGDTRPVITNIRRLAGQELDTGARLIAAATGALAVLGAGLLAVSYAAQRQYLFGARHENWPSVIEALSLDLAMLIFAMLALGLAKKGLPARTERAAVVVCAAGSALMNYLAADISSPRSVAAYVMPPILLALAADRVIAVVRRWVLGQQATEASVWRSISRAVAIGGLYVLRLAMAPVETPKGIRRVILAAAPLPAAAIEAPEGERQAGGDAVILPGPGETKKDVFLHLYRGHFAHGNRELASKTAAELAPRAGLQAGTARSYVYAELASIEPEASA